MLGRFIVALLIIAAAAAVTVERETAQVADMTATLAESKYGNAEERAQTFEKRAKAAETKVAELEAQNAWLQTALAEATHAKELALLPLELKTKNASVRGGLPLAAVTKVVRDSAWVTTPCFARARTRGPEITMKWVVDPHGHVVTVLNGGVPDGYDDVVDCLAREIKAWTFPRSPDLTFAQVTWVTRAPIAP